MLMTAKERGFHPRFVAFDSWYSSLENLKAIRTHGWHWLTRLKKNRQVDPDRTGNRALEACEISALGTVVHLKGYGMVQVFRIDTPDGDTEYWATDVVTMTAGEREDVAARYGRSRSIIVGSNNSVGWSGARREADGHNATILVGRFGRFCDWEHHRIRTGTSWFETKMGIIRSALQLYLSQTSPILVGLAQRLSTA
jgi:hypothetical protein